jgi:hypothetical protein
MHALRFIFGLFLLLITLLDGFETILVPRRINHRLRFSRFYYRSAWAVWRKGALSLQPGKFREGWLGMFGPLSLLGLFGSWMLSLVLAFAFLQWSTIPSAGPQLPTTENRFLDCLYFSGSTCFTLGLGDLQPRPGIERLYAVAECGIGFGFLAIIISYLPVLYQAFSRRESMISLLDARAGSPPSAGEFLTRLAQNGRVAAPDDILREWERWCSELLESHISFPLLAYYRSQHGNQSWLAALATMLDASALLLRALPAGNSYQAQLTFAMARHAAVDICLIFGIRPCPPKVDRLPEDSKARLHALLMPTLPESVTAAAAMAEPRLAELRSMYEPFLQAMADRFLLFLPPVVGAHTADNWQRSAWMPHTPGIGSLPALPARPDGKPDGDHFIAF